MENKTNTPNGTHTPYHIFINLEWPRFDAKMQNKEMKIMEPTTTAKF